MDPENITFEYIGRNDFVLYQQKNGFRFGTDSVLLAWFAASFVRRNKNNTMLELGANCGGATMCAAARLDDVSIDAVEIMKTPCEILRKNIEANKISGRVRAFRADLRELPQELKSKMYDVVFANPPFFNSDRGPATDAGSSSTERLNGRFEENGGLDDFVRTASARCRTSGGHVVMIMHGDRLKDLMEAYLRYKLTPTKLLTVHPSPGKNASMILLAGKKGSPRAELKILPPLFLDNSDGRVNRIYEEEHTDCFI